MNIYGRYLAGLALLLAGSGLSFAQTPGPYVRLDAGWSHPSDMTGNAGTGIASGSLTRDNGFFLGGAGGYQFGPWRGELELQYMENGVASGNNLFAGATGATARLSGSTSNLAVMVNGYYDIRTPWPITPYVGLGIGADYFRFNQVNTTSLSPNIQIANGFDTVFAYQPIVGASYAINSQWSVNLEYRYFGTTDPSIKYLPGSPQPRFTVNNASHNVLASVTFHFFPPPPPPPVSQKENLVVVLPEANGHVGAVVVHSANGTTVLDKSYAAAGSAAGSTAVKSVDVAPTEVSTIFGQALAAQPVPPRRFTLYFRSGSAVLAPQSRSEFEQVYADIKQRGTAEVVVTGHTDTVGSERYNDALSLKRAQRVRQMLIDRGIPASWMTIVAEGKRDLAVPTADQVSEPRNRRVLIDAR
jgi:OmpA-OmpF porin, OOP family